MISGLVDKHKKRPSTLVPKDAAESVFDQASTLPIPDQGVPLFPVISPMSSESSAPLLTSQPGVKPASGCARFGLVLDNAVNVRDADIKRGVSEDIARAAGVHASKVFIRVRYRATYYTQHVMYHILFYMIIHNNT